MTNKSWKMDMCGQRCVIYLKLNAIEKVAVWRAHHFIIGTALETNLPVVGIHYVHLIYIYIYIRSHIRRPRPLPRQGRRLGPPEVWNLALGSQAKAHAPKRFQPSRRPPRQQLLQLQLLLQDCRLLGLKPPKRFQPARRPPRQQLLQLLHAPAICLSGGSRLPFARPQIQGNNSYSYSYYFKTAVCSASNPPNASNPPAGPQGNNSYSYYMPLPSVFQGVQDCRLPALKPPKPSRRPPRHLPSVFQGVQDCRLPALKPPKPPKPSRRPPRQQLLQLHALKPPKRFQPSRRPPRQQLLQLLHAPAICFSGGSRLPFARPQTPQTLPTRPQASKATTLTATTCPCHLSFRGFKTAVCPPSNPRQQLLQLQLLLQDCRLLGLKPPKRFQPARRPPRQQLLQLLHAPAICLSGGSRLPFARPQTPQTLPQASKAPAICFSGGSRLPFARPQTPQTPQTLPQASKATTLTATCPQTPQTLPTLPQASKATTLTATTCPCHLFFRGFKTAVCPPSNPPNPPAGLQGNHSYSYMPSNPPNASYSYYMPLPSVFPGVQDCRLPGLKPPKRFQPSRRPPRQQLLQLLHAPAICFSGGSRLPFARPHTPQTLPQASKAPAICFSGGSSLPFGRPQTPQTLPQASKATTLTATCPQTPQTLPTLPQASKATTLTATTCPCHLFFRGFKTAVCPASNPPNASNPPAGLQGNNSCGTWLSGRKQRHTPPNASNPPAGLQGNNSYSYSYYFKTAVCSASNPPNASNPPAGLQGNNSYSYYMPVPSVFQGVQDCRLPALKSKATTFTATATTSRLPFARPQTPQTLPTRPQASKATTLTATTCPCHLSFRGFKTAVCPPSNPPNPPAGLQGTCHLFFRGFKTAVCPPSNPPNPPNPPAGLQGNNSYSYMPSNPPNASNPPAGLQGNNSYSYYMPLPSVFQGVQDCRLPALKPPLLLQDCRLLGLKPPKRFQPARRPPRQQLLQLLHAPGLTGGSRLPFARPQIQGNNSYSYSYYFKTAVCSASNPPNASNPPAGLQGNNSYSYYMPLPSVFQGVQDCRLPALKPPKPSRRPPRHLPSVFQGVQDCRLPALKPPKPPKPSRRPPRQQLLQLHALKPPKRFQPSRRPPRQQLLQRLHAPAICFSGGSRLPFARPQTPQTLPQASKATTLTATCPQTPQTLPTLPQASKATTLTATTCPCHLFFRGFKPAVCPASNPPNASNPPAGLQGNNSYSYYMPLPSVFQGVQDCRLPGLKPPKRFQPSRRPPRQQLLQLLHAPAICFSGGSRLPFARPQTPQTLPQASKAPAICFSGGSSLPFGRPQTPQTLPQASKATTLTATCPQTPQTLPTLPQASKATTLTATTCPCHLFFRGSRLPFARPQTPQTLPQASKATTLTATCPQTPQTLPTLPQASKATTLTATTRPCHLFFRGFKPAVCPASNPPNASNPPAGLQGNNSYSYYMPLPSVFQGVQDCRLPALKPPKPSRRPPRHLPSVFQGVQACRLAALKPPKPSRRPPRQELLQLHALKPPKRFQPSRRPPRQQLLQLLHAPAICLSGGSRLPLARPQTPQTFPQASKAPAICFSGGSRLPFARPQTPQTPQTLPQASKATTLTATCPQTPQTLPTLPQASKATTLTATTCLCHLLFRGFKTAVCPPSNPPNPPAGLQGNNSYSYMPSNPPNASNPPAGLQGNNSYSYYMPLPSVFPGVQDCRLPGLKPPKRFQPSRRPPRQQLLQLLHAPAICFSGGSSLPFARPQTPQTLPQASKAPAICFSGGSSLPFGCPQTPQTLPQASKATTLTATCPQTPQTLPTLPQASKATTLTATTCPCHLFFRGFKTAVCPASNPPNASNPPAGLQGNNSYSYYMPLPSVFQGVQDCRRPRPLPRQGRRLGPPEVWNLALGSQAKAHAPKRFQPSRRPPRQQLLQLQLLLQDCRLLGLKPPKRFQPARRPPRQQLLQLLHAPAICLSGGSRLPFARPQIQGNNSYSYSYYFKTAVCSASNPPNASNPPAGLQGNNSYSYYMPLPSVFQGVQDCRLPALKPPKPSRRPPRHLPSVFQGVHQDCAGLQGNNSYSYMPLPSVFQGVHGLQEPVIHRLFWGFCSGTNHFVFLHGFPAGVSWLT